MFVSLDLETTGFDPQSDKIVEFGAVKFDLNGQKETLKFFINPGVPVPQITTHITGITDADVKDAASIADKKEEISAFIGDLPIVGHNISFDTSFLKHYGIAKNNPEFDTLQFAGILFPSLPSYSLEILSHQLKLTHEEKHRALDDAIAAMELFLKLSDLFRGLEPALIAQIHQLVQRSNWPIKDFLLTLEAGKPTPQPITEIELPQTTEPDTSSAETILSTPKNSLFEVHPPLTPLVKALIDNAKNDTVIAVPNFLFQELMPQIPDTVAKIDSPKNYLSLHRLQTFLQKSFFEEYEITALIKILIWSRQTKTGLIHELNLFGREKSVALSVNVDPESGNLMSEPFIESALKKHPNTPTLATHEYLIDGNPHLKKLILVDFESFTNRVHYNLSSYISLKTTIGCLDELKSVSKDSSAIDSLLSKLTIFFGLIGIIFEKYNDADFFTPKSTITDGVTQTKEWLDLKALTANLISISSEITSTPETAPILKKWQRITSDLTSIFENTNLDDHLIWFEKDQNQEAVIRKSPVSIKEPIAKILANCETYSIVDENIDLNDHGRFLKKLFGLPEDLPLIKASTTREKLIIDIATNCPDRDPENTSVVLKFFEKELPTIKGRTALLFSSKKQLEFFTIRLTPVLAKAGITVISQLTGGIGKVCEQFKQNPDNSIVLLTTPSWERFPCSDMIETLYLHRLPFTPPSTPYIMSIGRNFENSFEGFQIPRTIFNLKRILNRLPKGRAVILDSRVANRDYSKKFLDNLGSIGNTSPLRIS
ncbi:MAG: exonuclease domain-containing protein [Candidatus Gracilibacteria bacterium]